MNYELLINLGKGAHRLRERESERKEREREYDKCPSIFDVTGLYLSEPLVCCIWMTNWHP